MIELQPIEYVGIIGPHSSIAVEDGKTIKVRTSDDTVGRHYSRCEIDRDGTLMRREMMDEQDRGILQFAIDRLRDQGQIGILDAGCGTGRTLFETRDQLIFRTGGKSEDVLAVGVNDIDFSDESQEVETRKSIANGDVKYIVSDLKTVELPSNRFDLITSFEVLTHIKPPKISKIIENLLPSLKDNGIFIFDIHPIQRSDPDFKLFLEEGLEKLGYAFSEYGISTEWGAERVFVRIRRKVTK